MEVTIGVDAVIKAAALLTALGVIGGVVVWCVKFVERQKKQDDELKAIREVELKAIREENCLLCYAMTACLDGLCQLGANHDVTTAKEKMQKHLNQAAHKGEE